MVLVYVPDAADKPAPEMTIIFLEPRRASWNRAMDSFMALLVQRTTSRSLDILENIPEEGWVLRGSKANIRDESQRKG